MKLDQSHVGNKFRRPGFEKNAWVRLVAIDSGNLFLVDEVGKGWAMGELCEDWELVSEPKKPSERIQEIALSGQWGGCGKVIGFDAVCILAYLDEQAEAKK